METYSVQILNPKAVQLLYDLADLNLIALQPEPPVEMQPAPKKSDRLEAHDLVDRVRPEPPTLHPDDMMEWLRESPPPFRDENEQG